MPAVRILVVTNLYPPAAVGGYERMCRDVVTRFRERGHELAVLTSTFRAPAESAEGVHRRLELYWDGTEIVCPPLRGQIARERANQRGLGELLRSFRPQAVSVWGMGALSLGLLTTASSRAAGPRRTPGASFRTRR